MQRALEREQYRIFWNTHMPNDLFSDQLKSEIMTTESFLGTCMYIINFNSTIFKSISNLLFLYLKEGRQCKRNVQYYLVFQDLQPRLFLVKRFFHCSTVLTYCFFYVRFNKIKMRRKFQLSNLEKWIIKKTKH